MKSSVHGLVLHQFGIEQATDGQSLPGKQATAAVDGRTQCQQTRDNPWNVKIQDNLKRVGAASFIFDCMFLCTYAGLYTIAALYKYETRAENGIIVHLTFHVNPDPLIPPDKTGWRWKIDTKLWEQVNLVNIKIIKINNAVTDTKKWLQRHQKRLGLVPADVAPALVLQHAEQHTAEICRTCQDCNGVTVDLDQIHDSEHCGACSKALQASISMDTMTLYYYMPFLYFFITQLVLEFLAMWVGSSSLGKCMEQILHELMGRGNPWGTYLDTWRFQ